MKILIIRGKNLASLEGEFEIDFTKEPLKSAGIFAITGSTGSGKSTILDAITLALFDKTPRTEKTKENITIFNADSLNQKDTRNILRRGTTDGYAEVEFISLGNERFRANWSVRRSRNKIDGTIQATSMQLFNITQNREVPGVKTEIKKEIERIIGLTFEQFTRSALLAQGDFATFLKAEEKEKSDLLEKLTGTEIYSIISTKIYEHAEVAYNELKFIQANIDGINVLSEEEINEKNQNIESLKNNAPILDSQIQKARAKINWLDENKKQEYLLNEAQNEVEKTYCAKRLASPRIEYIRKIDQFQEIMPRYISLTSSQKELDGKRESFASKTNSLEQENRAVQKIKEDVDIYTKKLQEQKELQDRLQPEIKKAIELDTQIANIKSVIATAKVANGRLTEGEKYYQNNLKGYSASIDATQLSIQEIKNWYASRDKFKEIIPDVSLIVEHLDAISNAEKQMADASKRLENQEILLKDNTDSLSSLNKDLEDLNSTLTTEIVILRSKLVDNSPCPVCGSLHHPITSTEVKNIKEDELEKAKAKLKAKIEKVQNAIKIIGEEIATIKSQHKRAMDDYDNFYPNVSKRLSPIGNWEESFKNGSLQDSLRKTAAKWNSYSSLLTKLQADLSTAETNKKNTEDRITENGESLTKSNSELVDLEKKYTELKESRATLIYGKTVQIMQDSLAQALKSIEDSLTKAKSEESILGKKKSELEGSLAQIKVEIDRLEEQIKEDSDATTAWINSHSNDFAIADIESIMGKDANWIRTERESLSNLDTSITKANSILTERKNTYNTHQHSNDRPASEEKKEDIALQLSENQKKQQEEASLLGAIGEQIKRYNESKAKIKTFEKELNSKRETAENWNRLNSLFGSKNGMKFRNIAQEYTLDILLSYANIHLQDLSDRYQLERIPDSLALQVIDCDMMDERRSVNLLSGGETFLVSLALALGLSSLTSNRMNIESLYIDEGFGSLDIDTLRVAMEALDHLQTQGKKIGVISHVEEMKERIHTQIRVLKSANGRSRIEISE